MLRPKNWIGLVLVLWLGVLVPKAARTQLVIGQGQLVSTNQQTTPFANFFEDSRHQYLYSWVELNNTGLVSGTITQIAFDVAIAHSHQTPAFQISYKPVSVLGLSSSTFETGFSTIFSDTVSANTTGWYAFPLPTPIVWNSGTSILLEVCFDNTSFSNNAGVRFSNEGYPCNRYAFADGATGCGLNSFNVINERPNLQITLVPNAPTAISAPSKICKGDSVQLTATGDLGDPIWFVNGCNGTVVDTGMSIWVQPNTTTTYYVANQAAGILSSTCASFTVEVTDLQLTLSETPPNCTGDSTGALATNLSGGVAPFSFSWSNGDSIAGILGLPAGAYFVTVTDSLGCQVSDSSILLAQHPLPGVFLGNDTLVCDSVVLAPGVGYAAYSWIDNSSGMQFTAPTAGSYWVEVTDSNGCSNRDTIVVNNFSAPAMTFSSMLATCGLTDGALTVSFTNSGPFPVLWSNGDTGTTSDSLAAGIYGLQVTDSLGCIHDTNVVLANGGAHTLIMSGFPADCPNGTNGSASAVVVGGVAPFTYLWNDPAGQAQDTAVQLSPGQYQVSVTDANQCLAFDSVTVGFTFPAAQPTLGGDTAICSGDSLLLSPGTFISYSWSGGGSSPSFMARAPMGITVTVTDTNGCTGSDSVFLSELSLPTVQLGNDTTFCIGDTLIYYGNNGFQYLWSDNSSIDSIVVTSPGLLWLEVTDFNLCRNRDTVQLSAFPDPGLDLGSDQLLCEGDTLMLNAGVSSGTLLWSNGSTADSLQVFIGGTYSVILNDTNGCHYTDSLTVTAVPQPMVDLGPDVDTICVPYQYELAVAGLTGVTYQWSTGQTDSNIQVGSEGIYWVEVTDGNGCRNADTLRLIEDPCVGVEELGRKAPPFAVFPNPGRGEVFLKSDFQGPLWLELRSADGQLLQRFRAVAQRGTPWTLPIPDLPAGTYWLTVHSTDDHYSLPLIRL